MKGCRYNSLLAFPLVAFGRLWVSANVSQLVGGAQKVHHRGSEELQEETEKEEKRRRTFGPREPQPLLLHSCADASSRCRPAAFRP